MLIVTIENRFISMSLFYVPNLTKIYRPKDFVDCTNDTLFYANAEGWEKSTDTLKEMNSTYHKYVQCLNVISKRLLTFLPAPH